MRISIGPLVAVSLLLILGACAPDENGPPDEVEEGLSAFQLEHGLGPFTDPVTLDDPIDEELANEGQRIFEASCEACHMMEDRFVGPPVGDILDRRTPTFVLNMIMNPEQMAREHPEVQELLREYPVIMPYQNISEDQARAILEYLRTTR